MRSLLYNWTPVTPGTNLLQIIYSNGVTGVVLSDVRSVILSPPPYISGLVGVNHSVVWSSVSGVNYVVLATTNLIQPFVPVSGVIPATGPTTSFMDVSNTTRRRAKVL